MKQPTNHRGSLPSYVIGFAGSLLLTLAAYVIVAEKLLSGWAAVYAIVGLALLQLFVQLLFFLHLGREGKPYWQSQVFIFMVGVVVILVFGSLWIMNNLNYHSHSSPVKTNRDIIKDEGYQLKP